jgi:hypothetical protein
MKQGGKVSKLLLLFLFGMPLTVFADAGTPLMWAGMLHLVFGNALIGIGEGLLLTFLFRLKRWKCITVMIAANYFSAWVGDLLVMGNVRNSDLDLYNAWRWIWAMVGITFVLTCVLEWPFVFFCLPKSDQRLKRSIWGNLLVQFASYLLLCAWYYSASARSLYTQAHIVRPGAITAPANAFLYFISTDGSAYSMKLPDGAPQKISGLGPTNQMDQLFLRGEESGKINVSARYGGIQSTNPIQLVDSNSNTTKAVPAYDKTNLTGIFAIKNDRWGIFQVGSATNSPWTFYVGDWSAEGLWGEDKQTGETIYIAFETPFVQWMIRNAYQLPNDCVVFQLGENQICMLDVKTRSVALVARGRDPVVVLE